MQFLKQRSTFYCASLSEIYVILVKPLSVFMTHVIRACYIKPTANNNSTIFHSVIEHTDFPAESHQIQFLIENSTKLLAHELTMLNANTDIELHYISVTRRCNCSWQGLLIFFLLFQFWLGEPIFEIQHPVGEKETNPIVTLQDLGCILAGHKMFMFNLQIVVQASSPDWSGGL